MHDMSSSSTVEKPPTDLHSRWTGRVVGYVAVLTLVNVMVDSVIASTIFVLPNLAEHFDTDQFAWLNSSAMLAGAMWAPLLGKSADIYGKRRILVITLLIAGFGGVVCLLAPNLGIFVAGRMLQGAAIAAMFLTVAIIRDICTPKFAMGVTGFVTTGNAIFGIASPFIFDIAIDVFDWQIVFVVSATLAIVATACVRVAMPKTMYRAPGRVDVAGAIVLGGGLAGVLAYISLGPELGWLAIGALAILTVGVVALLVWFFVLSRTPGPVIDIRGITLAFGLGLLVIVMGTGAYQSMLQLFSLLVEVSAEEGRGYGIAGPVALGLMFGVPSIGIVLGGVLSGQIATRIGPVGPLAAGLATGTTATAGMFFFGISNLPIAVICSFMLSLTAGTLVTSGFNLASILAPVERQATASGMVMIVIAIGSVVMNVIGTAVLNSTNMVVGGESVPSATGVRAYIAVAAGVFIAAAIPMAFLVRKMRGHVVSDVPVSHL